MGRAWFEFDLVNPALRRVGKSLNFGGEGIHTNKLSQGAGSA
jgi:hypothetical protein